MPLDSIITGALARELNGRLHGCRIDKIYQPSKFGFSFAVRTDGGNARLNVSCSDKPYVYISREKPENPDASPMLCMLLRKHLTGARILSVDQPACERIINFNLECTDEIGEKNQKKLIIELIGKHSNLILAGSDGRIIECARRVDYEMSELRQVLPNLFYNLPPMPRGKLCFTDITRSALIALADSAAADMPARQFISDNFFGLCPLICREAAFRAAGSADAVLGQMTSAQKQAFIDFLCGLSESAEHAEPYLLIKNGENIGFDFSFMPITQYPDVQLKKCGSLCDMLAEFYDARESACQLASKKRELCKTLAKLITRAERKLEAQTAELAQAREREKLRRFADLLTANLYAAGKGTDYIEVTDYFDEAQPTVKIPLDPSLSPHKNAQKYYYDYAKKKNAEKFLTAEIERVKNEIEYLKSVSDALDRCEESAVIAEIRDELCGGGYIKQSKKVKKVKPAALRPKEYKTPDGFIIKAGRSNRENEYLSLKAAMPNDLWFHVKNTSGAHILLLCRDGREPTDAAIRCAAMLAVYHSSAKMSADTAVDYTKAKFVKKLHGGAPGMVNYSNFQTVRAAPDAAQIEQMLKYAQESGE